MKRLFFFLLPLFLFTACKKEADSPGDAKRLLQGFWRVTSDKYEYFDQSGTRIHALPETKGQGYTLDGNELAYTDGDNQDHQTTFTVYEEKGQLFIELHDSSTYKITTMNRDNMTWERQDTYPFYTLNQQVLKAFRAENIIQFEKD